MARNEAFMFGRPNKQRLSIYLLVFRLRCVNIPFLLDLRKIANCQLLFLMLYSALGLPVVSKLTVCFCVIMSVFFLVLLLLACYC